MLAAAASTVLAVVCGVQEKVQEGNFSTKGLRSQTQRIVKARFDFNIYIVYMYSSGDRGQKIAPCRAADQEAMPRRNTKSVL